MFRQNITNFWQNIVRFDEFFVKSDILPSISAKNVVMFDKKATKYDKMSVSFDLIRFKSPETPVPAVLIATIFNASFTAAILKH